MYEKIVTLALSGSTTYYTHFTSKD